MSYKLIEIKKYLDGIKEKYLNNPDLWYKTIIPKEKADELIKKFDGDYSLLWHEHCSNCYEVIDLNKTHCYYDDESEDWLCECCYKKKIKEKF